MNRFFSNISVASRDPHVSIPFLIAVVLEVFPIWFPQYKDQCYQTQKVLIGYGIVAAYNSQGSTPAPPHRRIRSESDQNPIDPASGKGA